MKKKTLWITQTALMLALLLALQWATKPLGQLVTGSCVNGILAVTVLFAGMVSGITVAVLSPLFAFFLGIAPNLVTVPVIMVGNTVYVILLKTLYGSQILRRLAAWLVAAAVKFAVLYGLVEGVICNLLSDALLGAGILKTPMLNALPATFSWPQLVTALIGGGIALLIVPVLRKALRKG